MGFFAGADGRSGHVVYATWSGFGQLDITDATGAILQTERVHAYTAAGPITSNDWATNVNVLSGHQYAFTFTPEASSVPDPYGVKIAYNANGQSGYYAGGQTEW